MLTLDDILNTAGAAEAAGVPLVTFKSHIYDNLIVPISLSSRSAGHGHFLVFTKRMVEIYSRVYRDSGLEGLRAVAPIAPTAEETESVFLGSGAAEFIGKNYNTFRVQVRQGKIKGKGFGQATVFLKDDLLLFKNRPDGRRVKKAA